MTATYDSVTNTISVINGINTLSTMYSDINNPSVFSKTEDTYTLNATLIIRPDATLNITNNTLLFNGSYRIWTKGALYIEDSTITSINKTDISQRGWIMGRRYPIPDSGYILQIRNSTISHLGPMGLDEFGEYKWGIFAYPSQTGDGTTRAPVIIDNNDISHLNMAVGKHTYPDYIRNNIIHDIDSGYNTAVQFYSALFENNTVYNMPNNYGIYILAGNAVVRNNHLYNVYAPDSGAPLRTKEGEGGFIIENNIIHDGSGLSAINTDGSNKKEWSYIRNNTIYNFTGTGIYTVGNCYLNGTSVMQVISDNIMYNLTSGPGYACYGGLHMSRTPYFGPPTYPCGSEDGLGVNGAKDVIWKNNTVYNSNKGITIEGGKFENVSFVNNNLFNNTIDIYFSNGSGGRPKAGTIGMPNFINNKYTILNIPDGLYKQYVYLDVRVVDTNGNSINEATVTVINNIDPNFPSININGETKTSFITGADGHTPLPSDGLNTCAILHKLVTSTTTQLMTYTIKAEFEGQSYTIDVIPNDTWYRTNPESYQNTIQIQLSVEVECPQPICKIILTQL